MTNYTYKVQSNYTGGQGSYHYFPDVKNITCEIQPLIQVLHEYDAMKRKLEDEGGVIADFREMVSILEREVNYSSMMSRGVFSLTDQASVRKFVKSVSYTLHFDVRVNKNDLPVYYICRTKSDFWREYDLVVQDLYLSPGYVFADPRFASLLQAGREAYLLRLSRFRKDVSQHFANSFLSEDSQIDSYLFSLGNNILQALWHEDQRFGFEVADHFELQNFRSAIELLYLCLGGDLCDVRVISDIKIQTFFRKIYPNNAISGFLSKLTNLNGREINRIPSQAEKLYIKLMKQFRKFLTFEIVWGSFSRAVPLWKVLCANLGRINKVKEVIQDRSQFKTIRSELESTAKEIINQINGN